MADHLRERLSGMMETYHALVARRTLGATKTIAVVVTLALPLALIVAVYGATFKPLPGLGLEGGHYPMLVGIVTYLTASIAVFKKKRWF